MGNLSKAAKSLVGIVEYAYIDIHDFRSSKGRLKDKAALDQISNVLTKGINCLPNLDETKTFMVQYNPSELQVYTTQTETKQVINVQKEKDQPPTTEMVTVKVPSAELSATLYFDNMTVADSFMLDKPVVPGSVSGVTNIVKSFKAGESSVQKEVEGFLAAVRNPLTRLATFYWSDFSFTGALTSVTAEYTMFSTFGRPVRAKVSMRIRRLGEERNFSSWEDDFKNAFSGDGTNLVKPEQTVGNIFNVNLGL